MTLPIGFIGHNGFAFGEPAAPLLIDPILFPRYADDPPSSPVEIYPPRLFERDQFPNPSAVVISHEHSDHFHIRSLNLLARDTPILVGPLMPQGIVDPIERLGFTVTRLRYEEPRVVGGVVITLYQAHPDTVLWESRVSQVYVQAAPNEPGIFLSIDALVSNGFVDAIVRGQVPAPRAIALSNNAQVTPPGVFGSLDNLRMDGVAVGAAQTAGFAALDVASELLTDYIAEIPSENLVSVMIAGGGFMKDYEAMGPFPFSEQDELARAVATLIPGIQIVGAVPGQGWVLSQNGLDRAKELGWVRIDAERFRELRSRRDSFLASGGTIGLKQVDLGRPFVDATICVEAGLEDLAHGILTAPLGARLLADANSGAVSTRPLVLVLLDAALSEKGVGFALDLAAGGFVPCAEGSNLVGTLRSQHPHGLVVHASDLAAMLDGSLQIWDLVGVAMHSWFDGDRLDSMVGMMYDFYGEQSRPDIALRTYRRQIDSVLAEAAMV